MTHYSVLIPQRDAAPQLERQVPRVVAALAQLGRSHEVLCIDDGSGPLGRQAVESLSRKIPSVRAVCLNRARGISIALTAGIAAARGDVVIAMEAGLQYDAEQIALLVSHLNRADLVFGHRRLAGLAKAWHRVGRIPRWLTWGLDVRDPGCLFWAARREAVQGLQLAAGMFRYVPLLVRVRGYRVGEVYVNHRDGARSASDSWCRPSDLVAAIRDCRRPRLFVPNEAADSAVSAHLPTRKDAA